jgi:replication-associated recombination protein RarA
MIRSRTSQAVFLMAGPGIGKSALAEAITEPWQFIPLGCPLWRADSVHSRTDS